MPEFLDFTFVLMLERLERHTLLTAVMAAAGVEDAHETPDLHSELLAWLGDEPKAPADPERAELLAALGVRGG